eukprot:208824-Rhodomonas_salina.2
MLLPGAGLNRQRSAVEQGMLLRHIARRIRLAVCGTDLGYAATRRGRGVRRESLKDVGKVVTTQTGGLAIAVNFKDQIPLDPEKFSGGMEAMQVASRVCQRWGFRDEGSGFR